MCSRHLEWFVWLGILLVTGSCAPDLKDLKEVPLDMRWQISIPASMNPVDAYPKAVLAYADRRLPLFLMIRTDSLPALQDRFPRAGLQDHYESHLLHLQEEMEKLENQMPDTVQIAGMQGLQGSWEADFKRDRVYCQLTLLQSQTSLYQVFCWTTTEQQAKLAPIMAQMSASFHPRN